uniref:PAW domain-containing protein n=1 Tax=Rhizophora mucronata TaxID=61149 RepID=A0A2P2P7W8_RHIMU
MKWSFDIK